MTCVAPRGTAYRGTAMGDIPVSPPGSRHMARRASAAAAAAGGHGIRLAPGLALGPASRCRTHAARRAPCGAAQPLKNLGGLLHSHHLQEQQRQGLSPSGEWLERATGEVRLGPGRSLHAWEGHL